MWLSFKCLFFSSIRNVICQNPFHSSPEKEQQKKHSEGDRILPACSVRRAWCTEDGSVSPWSASSAGNTPLEGRQQVLIPAPFAPLITELMYCHTWLMGSVAYQGPWSICEHFNSNMENCMSEYQRVMPARLCRGRWFLAGSYLPETLLLTAIRSHSATIYSTITFVLLLYACFSSHKYKCMIIFIWIESLPAQSLAYWLLMLRGRGGINAGCTEYGQIK